MLWARDCDVCGRRFYVEGISRQRICSDKCREIRTKERRREINAMYKARKKIEESRPESNNLDEVAKLAREAGMTYGMYVGLRWLRGVKV